MHYSCIALACAGFWAAIPLRSLAWLLQFLGVFAPAVILLPRQMSVLAALAVLAVCGPALTRAGWSRPRTV